MAGIPPPSTSDSDDVVWALQTAATQWERGEQRDAAVWLQRAARAASEAGDDDRALELGRRGAELLDSLPAQEQGAKQDPVAQEDDAVALSSAIAIAVTIDDEHFTEPAFDDDGVITSAPPMVLPERAGAGHDGRLRDFRTAKSFIGVRDAKPFIDAIEREAELIEPQPRRRRPPPPPPFVPPKPRPDAPAAADSGGIEVVVAAEEPAAASPPPAPPAAPPPEDAPRESLEPLSLEPLSGGLSADQPSADELPSLATAAGVLPEPPAAEPQPEPGIRERATMPSLSGQAEAARALPTSSLPPEPDGDLASATIPAPPQESGDRVHVPESEPLSKEGDRVSLEPVSFEPLSLDPLSDRRPTGGSELSLELPAARDEVAGLAETRPASLPEAQAAAVDAAPASRSRSVPAPPIAQPEPKPPLPERRPSSIPAPPLVRLSLYDAFADVPDEQLADFETHAEVQRVARDEEVSGFGLALVVDGEFHVAAMVSDVFATKIGPASVLRMHGSVPGSVEVRLVCASRYATLATWSEDLVQEAFGALPWVDEELLTRADQVHALVGATLGPLGNELDSGLLSELVRHMQVRVLVPGEVVMEQGADLPGLVVVGMGVLEREAEPEPGAGTSFLPGDFVFASAVLEGGGAPATVRAGPDGAVVLWVDRAVTQELFMTFPPLLDLLLRL